METFAPVFGISFVECRFTKEKKGIKGDGWKALVRRLDSDSVHSFDACSKLWIRSQQLVGRRVISVISVACKVIMGNADQGGTCVLKMVARVAKLRRNAGL